jgi:iron complex transport system substrate-binding protein
VAKRPGWENLKAVKDGHVMLVDDNLFSRPTPRNVDALEMLAKWLHPDLIQ